MTDMLAKRTEQFIAIRDKLKQMDDAYEATKKPLLDIQNLLSGWFEKFLTETGQQSAVTPLGTIHWNTRYTTSVSDADEFMKHVIATQDFDLLDRRANATAVKEYAGKHGALPPGVNLNAIRTVGVKKPGVKAKNAGTVVTGAVMMENAK